jgi:hypothetical protein
LSDRYTGEPLVLGKKRVADSDALLLEIAVLAFLSEPERNVVGADGELVEFKLRQSVYAAEAPIDAVYFPIDCVLSVEHAWKTEV